MPLRNVNRNIIPANRGIPPYINTVPDYLSRYLLDTTDTNVVPINSPILVTGKARPDLKAFEFNGIDKYATVNADSAKVAFATGALSIAFWAKSTDTGSTSAVIGNGSGGSGNGTFRTPIFANGKAVFRTDGTNKTSNSLIKDGLWHHVVFTSSGALGDFNIYIDGSLDKNDTSPDYNIIDSGVLTIAISSIAFMDGCIDDIRYYGRELSSPEVSSIFGERSA